MQTFYCCFVYSYMQTKESAWIQLLLYAWLLAQLYVYTHGAGANNFVYWILHGTLVPTFNSHYINKFRLWALNVHRPQYGLAAALLWSTHRSILSCACLLCHKVITIHRVAAKLFSCSVLPNLAPDYIIPEQLYKTSGLLQCSYVSQKRYLSCMIKSQILYLN